MCLNSPTYQISLTGTAEVCTDPETCREMWYEGLSNHFSGPDDPNFCVIRFTTRRYSLFIDWEDVEGAGRIAGQRLASAKRSSPYFGKKGAKRNDGA